MGDVADDFAAAFRDFNTVGVPASGPFKPVKSDIRALGIAIETAIAAGIPGAGNIIVPGLAGSTVELVAGTIRQNVGNLTHWDYINDANHTPVGVDGDFALASGSSITINFAKTYSRVLTMIVGTDETLANAHGMTVGASVGLSSAVIQASARLNANAIVRYTGSAWSVANTPGTSFFGTPSYTGSTLTIPNTYCPGTDVQLTPYTFNGSLTPFMPLIKNPNHQSTDINFLNMATGALHLGGVDPSMSFLIRKSYQEGIVLSGASGATGNAADMNLTAGNIWFIGAFEV